MSIRLSRILSLFSISLLVGACTTVATPSGDQSASSSAAMESSSAAMEQSSAMMEQKAASSGPAAMMEEDDDDDAESVSVDVDAAMTASPRVISVSAANFAFTPNAITVKKGEKVRLRIVGTEGNHGFGIPDLGINVTVPEGGTVEVDLPTDTAGTFAFRCTVPCGSGHKEMTGILTVR